MMDDDDPKEIALAILRKKKGGDEPKKDGLEDEPDEGLDGESAVRDFFEAGSSGDFSAAYAALKAAVTACQGD